MKNLKDTFYITLRDRLAALNPARTALIGGESRPAIAVTENEAVIVGRPELELFYLVWRKTEVVPEFAGMEKPLLRLECLVEYAAAGTDVAAGTDRGSVITAMDCELQQITQPGHATVNDYSTTPATDTTAPMFWGRPMFDALKSDGSRLVRSAIINVFGYAQEAA